jgi:hypothetical protein
MTTKTDILDDIISTIGPENIPPEFIVMAKVKDMSGIERIIRGPELAAMMTDPNSYEIAEARVILNLRKIRVEILNEVRDIYERANQMFLI